jgi:hypothetical protein
VVFSAGVVPAPLTLRVRSLSELPFYQANLQFGSVLTEHLADLVPDAISPYPKNYSYDSSTQPSSSGRCPAATLPSNIYSKQSLAPVNKHPNIAESHHPRQHIMAADLKSAQEKPAISGDGYHDQQSSEPDQTAIEKETKDNVVDWDGSDDPQNLRNWPAWKRMTQVVLPSAFLLTAYGSSGEANPVLTNNNTHTAISPRQCLHLQLPRLLRSSISRVPPWSVSPCPFTLAASPLGQCSLHRYPNCTDALRSTTPAMSFTLASSSDVRWAKIPACFSFFDSLRDVLLRAHRQLAEEPSPTSSSQLSLGG